MKRINVWMVALMALLLGLTSCSQERDVNPSNGVALEVSTSIDNLTRVTGDQLNQWETTDKIGVYVKNDTKTLARNAEFTAAGAGLSVKFNPTKAVTIPGDGSKYDVYAYYPYTAGVTDEYTISLPTTTPVLWAKSATQVSYSNPESNLNFNHVLGRIVINVVVDAVKVDGAAAPTISIADMLTGGTMATADASLTNGATGALELIEGVSYLMPGQVIAGKVVTITYDNKVYKATFPTAPKAIEAGKSYTYKITLHANEAEFVAVSNPINGMTYVTGEDMIAAPEAVTTPAPVIKLASNPLSIGSGEYTGSVAVTLENATEFTVTDDPNASWITAAASTDFKSIELIAVANTGAERTANIVVKAGETSVTLVVTQEAKQVSPVAGDGTEANPFSVTEAITNQGKNDVWVVGYILGGTTNGSTVADSNTAILLGVTNDASGDVMPVQLPSGAIRDALSVQQHPENVGKKVMIRGNLETYMRKPGHKNADDYKFL